MMLKLIRLEWKKNNVRKSVLAAVIMTVILCFLIVCTSGELISTATVKMYDSSTGSGVGTNTVSVGETELNGENIFEAAVQIFTHMSYIIFTGVMIAGYIVGAYEKKTMNLMFSYPINRKKIILSKILAVWIFNAAALIVSKIVIYVILYKANPVVKIPAEQIPAVSTAFWLKLFLSSAAMVSIAFIALPVGLMFRSSKAAIVAAVIIVCFSQGNIGAYTLADSVPFYMILFALAAVSVILSVCPVERKDVV